MRASSRRRDFIPTPSDPFSGNSPRGLCFNVSEIGFAWPLRCLNFGSLGFCIAVT